MIRWGDLFLRIVLSKDEAVANFDRQSSIPQYAIRHFHRPRLAIPFDVYAFSDLSAISIA